MLVIGTAFWAGSRRSCGYHHPSLVLATAIRVTFGPVMAERRQVRAEVWI